MDGGVEKEDGGRERKMMTRRKSEMRTLFIAFRCEDFGDD
jgi:hypothetical protein